MCEAECEGEGGGEEALISDLLENRYISRAGPQGIDEPCAEFCVSPSLRLLEFIRPFTASIPFTRLTPFTCGLPHPWTPPRAAHGPACCAKTA